MKPDRDLPMTKPDKPPKDRVRPLVLVVTLVSAVGGYAVVTTTLRSAAEYRHRQATASSRGLSLSANDRLDRIIEHQMQPLVSSPLFEKHFEARVAKRERAGKKVDRVAFARQLGRDLVARGLARLSNADLLAIHELRKKMIVASERACPCYWDSAGCSQADVMDGVSRFNDFDLAAWSRLSVVAAFAELKAAGPVASIPAELTRGLAAVLELVPSEQRPRLDAVIEAGETNATPSKA
jgi:hypothetical protein